VSKEYKQNIEKGKVVERKTERVVIQREKGREKKREIYIDNDEI
jgi:hypothetical protein